MEQLGPAAKTSGAQHRSPGKGGKVVPFRRHDGVPWIVPFSNRRQLQPVRLDGGQVLQAVHCEIDPAGQQRLFYLPDEHTPVTASPQNFHVPVS